MIKKIVKTIMLFTLIAGMMLATSLNGSAATKKSKAQAKPLTEDEIQLSQLTAYRDALVSIGAPADQIELANKAILAKQAQIQYQAAITKMLTEREAILNKGASAPTTGVIFIGDSRFVQTSQAVGPTGVTFVAEGGKGYDWFVENAIPRVDPLVVAGTKVVINLGVNDTQNIDKYIAIVNKWAAIWNMRGAKVYYATVNPVWENPYTSKEQVINFNSKLINGLVGVNIIDTNTYLTLTGYRMVDGMHFDTPTNINVYLYIMGSI